MAKGIIITGSAGSGKTTLGKIVAEKLGFHFVDIDDCIWRFDTEIPYTKMYSKEEKIANLNNAIKDCEFFVMAGSMDSFHEHFDDKFTLSILLNADAKVRVQRANARAIRVFGNRAKEGGDYYENHQKFLVDLAGYDLGYGSTTLQKHTAWLNSLPCKTLFLDGEKPLEENAQLIVNEYKNL